MAQWLSVWLVTDEPRSPTPKRRYTFIFSNTKTQLTLSHLTLAFFDDSLVSSMKKALNR